MCNAAWSNIFEVSHIHELRQLFVIEIEIKPSFVIVDEICQPGGVVKREQFAKRIKLHMIGHIHFPFVGADKLDSR